MPKFAFLLAATALLLTAAEPVPATEQAFAKNAAQDGLAEIQLGKLALTKATDQNVKDFGQKMVDAHTRISDDLRALAGQKDIMIPTDLTSADQALVNQLSGLSGDAFDKAYMSAMVKDHQTDLAGFQKEANSGADKDLRGYASRTLPILRQHLQLAKSIAASVGAAGTN
jgi:putative membrane protein